MSFLTKLVKFTTLALALTACKKENSTARIQGSKTEKNYKRLDIHTTSQYAETLVFTMADNSKDSFTVHLNNPQPNDAKMGRVIVEEDRPMMGHALVWPEADKVASSPNSDSAVIRASGDLTKKTFIMLNGNDTTYYNPSIGTLFKMNTPTTGGSNERAYGKMNEAVAPFGKQNDIAVKLD